MKTKVKKKYMYVVSVRDYIVDKCIEEQDDLIILHDDKQMTVPFLKVIERNQLHRRKFTSKFDGSSYELIDFIWRPDR